MLPQAHASRREHHREVSWVWDMPLNESNQDLRVNFLSMGV